MEIIQFFLDFLKDPLTILTELIQQYGVWIYAILFLIIFTETGVVVMPFLPGDSLLFSIGLLAGSTSDVVNSSGKIELIIVIPLLILAALLGDNLNYFIGNKFGDFIQSKEKILFLKREHIEETEKYFEKNGPKTIILARFVPIIRTITPFVAGAGEMKYPKFLMNCILGAILWVVSITLLGYFLGNIPIIKENFEKVVLLIVFISILPIISKAFKRKK